VFNEWVKDPVIEVLPEEELKNPAYYLPHQGVFNEWVKDPVTEVLPEEELKNPAYYLPHQGVFNENSMTKIKTGV